MVDFKDQLRRQLLFIQNSADRFDRGDKEEAIRIATSIRVLLHDTAASTSLLTHLSAKSIKLLSSAGDGYIQSLNPDFFDAFTQVSNGKPAPCLGDSPPGYYVQIPIDQWWTQPVYIVPSYRIQRRHIVLAAANKDGGAHVDAALTPEYEALMQMYAIRFDDTNRPPLPVPIHLFGMRQMAYELLQSPELLALK